MTRIVEKYYCTALVKDGDIVRTSQGLAIFENDQQRDVIIRGLPPGDYDLQRCKVQIEFDDEEGG